MGTIEVILLGFVIFIIALPFGLAHILFYFSKFISDLFTKTIIGYGWVIRWDPEKEISYIRARLAKGPAGRNGVKGGEILTAIDGKPLSELPKKEWKPGKLMPFIPRWEYNEEHSFTLMRRDGSEYTITMKAKVIFCGVPIYENWPEGTMDRMQTEGHFVPTTCRRTGVMYFPFFRNRY